MRTACPYDCYDGCSIDYIDGKFKGDKTDEVTQGYLCEAFNNLQKIEKITTPKFRGEEIPLDESLQILINKLHETSPSKTLYYKGSGNFGVMQDVSKLFFSEYGATQASGSLCDGAGLAGIESNRGSSRGLPISVIDNSEVVIIWGRDVHTTNSHLLPHLKNKKVVVIDPVETKIAKNADLFLQIKPHTDLLLALLISRFLVIEGLEDVEFIQNRTDGFQDFHELTQSLRIKDTLTKIGITLGELGDVLHLLSLKKVVILIGVGVQKYLDGDEVLRAIDAIGAILGLFGKSDSGVGYLSQSQYGVLNPFDKKFAKNIPKVKVDFSEYDLIFIQGSNPLHTLPNIQKVQEQMKNCFVVYFGEIDNVTSNRADLVIPSTHFLTKEDKRFSYFHTKTRESAQLKNAEYGISEYDLTTKLMGSFGFESLQQPQEYLQNIIKDDEDVVPYKNSFDTEDGLFHFMDEFDDATLDNEGFYLITKKDPKGINSSIVSASELFVHPGIGYSDGEIVNVSNGINSALFTLRVDSAVREDCVLIYASALNVNVITSDKLSYLGEGATYQHVKININKV